jgi:hypothetical protein
MQHIISNKEIPRENIGPRLGFVQNFCTVRMIRMVANYVVPVMRGFPIVFVAALLACLPLASSVGHPLEQSALLRTSIRGGVPLKYGEDYDGGRALDKETRNVAEVDTEASGNIFGIEEQSLTELEKKWYISKPEFEYVGYQFNLQYNVSDYIDDASASYQIFDSHECEKGGNEITDNNEYLLSTLQLDLKKPGNGSSYRDMTLNIIIEPTEIRSSPLYADFGAYGHVYFCVRFSAFHQQGEGINEPIEANWVETPVLLVINNDFSIATSNSAGFFRNAYTYAMDEEHEVEAYLCDSDSNSVQGGTTRVGSPVRICITPANSTLEDGGFMWYIEELTFVRDNHTHLAIEPGSGGEPASNSTVVSCEPGSTLCAFETVLEADFFTSMGIIEAIGTVFLQFSDVKADSHPAMAAVRSGPTKIDLKFVALPQGIDDNSASSSRFSTIFICITVMTTMIFSF